MLPCRVHKECGIWTAFHQVFLILNVNFFQKRWIKSHTSNIDVGIYIKTTTISYFL